MPAQLPSDSLTRTALLMDENLSPLALDNVIAALKRVPGVLLAELEPGTARAIVAHDAAVANASLLEAATKSGAHVTLAAGARAPSTSDVSAVLPLSKERRRFLLLAVIAFVAPLLFSVMYPRLTGGAMFLPIALSYAGAFVIVRVFSGQRP